MSYGSYIDPLWMNNPLTSGVDYSKILSDPWFIQAQRAYNVNFRGGAQDNASVMSAGNEQSGVQPSGNTQTAVEGGIPVTQNTNESSDSGIGAGTAIGTVGALALITTAVVAAKKGKLSKAADALEKVFSKVEGLATKPMKTFKMITKNGSEIVVKDGKPVKVAARAESKVLNASADIQRELGKTPQFCDSTTGKLAEHTTVTRFAQQERVHFDGTKDLTLSDGVTTLSYDSNGVIQKLRTNGYSSTSADSIETYLKSNTDLKTTIEKELETVLLKDKFIIELNKERQYYVAKVITSGGAEKVGAELTEYLQKNEKVHDILRQRAVAIQEGRFDKFNELEEVSFVQRIPEKDAIYTRTFDGKEKLVIRGKLGKPMSENESKAWLHQHQDEYKTQLDEILASGKSKGVKVDRFSLEGNDYRVIANEKGEIEEIYTTNIFGRMKKESIKKNSQEYHRWLQDHPEVEKEANELATLGLGTDSEQTVFRMEEFEI